MRKSLCKRAEIEPPFGFHSIRHFMATYLADTIKTSKKTISVVLDLKSLQTTEIYLHSIDKSQEDAVKTIEGYFK